MANEKKTSRKKFRVAVSGSTVDGREISPVHLREAAENFNPDVYAARVNVEHYLSPCPSSEFSAMGDVTALSTEDITEGPLAGRTALYAEIEPTERMKQLVADGKKIYSSIELHPQFSVNGRAYLVGLAMTDTPASLGTERLKFTAQQRQAVMTFNSVQGEAPLIHAVNLPDTINQRPGASCICLRGQQRKRHFATCNFRIKHARKHDAIITCTDILPAC